MSDKKLPLFRKVLFSLCGTAILFVAVELLLQIGVLIKLLPYYYPLDNSYYSYNIAPYFSKACCKRDSITGFRWLDTGGRAYKVCKGQIVFDQVIKPNSAGFISPSEFEPQKKDTSVFRWLVFGDSFTDGYFLIQNWPTVVSEMIKSKKEKIEIHSFALNGSGLKTWARIFDWLNRNNYDYDGIIIACFGNDMMRDDFVMDHSDHYCLFGWADLDDKTKSMKLSKEPLIFDAGSSDMLREILAGQYAWTKPRLLLPYFTAIAYTDIRRNTTLKYESDALFNRYILTYKGEKTTDSTSMIIKYGPDKIKAMQNMLISCNQKNKRIILASVPDMKGMTIHKTEDDIRLNIELKWLASRYHAVFFDGYSISGDLHPEQFFLKNDGHWNQSGSDLYASKISGLIIGESKRVQ